MPVHLVRRMRHRGELQSRMQEKPEKVKQIRNGKEKMRAEAGDRRGFVATF